MTAPEFPTPWQRKTLWVAIAALSVVIIGAIGVGLVWLISRVLGFLQPILIPFAVAAVMAYLLDPVVTRIVSWGTSRHRAVLAVFTVVTLVLIGLAVWVVPAISRQTENLVHKVPRYTKKAKVLVVNFAHAIEQRTSFHLLPGIAPASEVHAEKDTPTDPTATPSEDEKEPPADATSKGPDAAATQTGEHESESAPVVEPPKLNPAAGPVDLQYDWNQLMSGDWVRTALPAVLRNLWEFVTSSVGGFLGVFGFLLSMIIVPVYLYYFLIESRNIAESWGDYVPLRASAFKDEVVSALEEINGYLIAFFRGQLLVSLINGSITGLGLVAVGLDFGLLIGLLLCLLNLIPYLGIMICWVPAVIIASVQGDAGTWIPGDPWWVFPLVVTAIFIVVQQIDGLFVTPKIVGESVGLHPMTVIVSVFVWSLLMGGLLGAILAVPMTATLKVLLKRYVWERRFKPEASPPEEAISAQRAPATVPEPSHAK